MIDDSIVRGTTTKGKIKSLREAGAKEVHLRVSSPPYKNPCFYGMDTVDQLHRQADAVRVPAPLAGQALGEGPAVHVATAGARGDRKSVV